MKELIQLSSFPVRTTLNILLKDKTTKKNIIWATSSYEQFGEQYADDRQMTAEALTGLNPVMLQPRIMKAMEQQQERTKSHAEVFTPAWICNKMNNYCDEEWFGRKDVFNILNEKEWVTTKEKIEFPQNRTWQQYVDSRRLEITCGEAPYIVSRYDAATGGIIPLDDRIGILDRKMRVINENTDNEEDWLTWTIRAYQSVYGYEYQGDNLLIGRINLLMTFVDYLDNRWHREATAEELKKIANIIVWNFWQMDGLTGTVPLGEPEEETHQYSLFELYSNEEDKLEDKRTPKCRIFDWRGSNKSIMFESVKRQGGCCHAN
ncbi:MAG: restriction endonuclease subunit M [Bacteroides fragilis]|nr:restriction endonuclease subunit M [Bacteroides fragilis]